MCPTLHIYFQLWMCNYFQQFLNLVYMSANEKWFLILMPYGTCRNSCMCCQSRFHQSQPVHFQYKSPRLNRKLNRTDDDGHSTGSVHHHLAKQVDTCIETVHCKKFIKSTVKLLTGHLLIDMVSVMLDGLMHFFLCIWLCVLESLHVCTNRLILFPGFFAAANALKCSTFKAWSGKQLTKQFWEAEGKKACS